MSRLHAYDDDSIDVGVIPRPCPCGEEITWLRLSLDVVTSSQGDFLGIRSISTAPCCGVVRSAPYPAELLAALLEHLCICPNH